MTEGLIESGYVKARLANEETIEQELSDPQIKQRIEEHGSLEEGIRNFIRDQYPNAVDVTIYRTWNRKDELLDRFEEVVINQYESNPDQPVVIPGLFEESEVDRIQKRVSMLNQDGKLEPYEGSAQVDLDEEGNIVEIVVSFV